MLRNLICTSLCRYYKPARPEQGVCGGVSWLLAQEAPDRFVPSLRGLATNPWDPLSGRDPESAPMLAVCRRCEYQEDGCDFRDPAVPREECSPCGGLAAIAALLCAGFDLGL
jgi:hypothetical protein